MSDAIAAGERNQQLSSTSCNNTVAGSQAQPCKSPSYLRCHETKSKLMQQRCTHTLTARITEQTSESESVLRYLLKKLLLLFSRTFSSAVLVMFPLCTRYMPSGLFTKNG